MHAGVMEEVSGTVFRRNSAGNEGPAVLSLGIVQSISNVIFGDNVFFCDVGTYSREAAISPVSYPIYRFGKVLFLDQSVV